MRQEIIKRTASNFGAVAIAAALAAVPAMAQRAPLFSSEILPIFEKNCTSCHGSQQKMASLDLSSFAGMMAGSASGPVIAPGKPERSLLWKMIESGQMPQGGKLNAADKQSIHAYIEQGRFPAQAPESEAEARKKELQRITDKDRAWWSFQKPVKVPPPAVSNKAQATSDIDRFVLAQLEAKGYLVERPE